MWFKGGCCEYEVEGIDLLIGWKADGEWKVARCKHLTLSRQGTMRTGLRGLESVMILYVGRGNAERRERRRGSKCSFSM